MHELQPAYLAGRGSVQVHRPWPPRAGVGPPLHHGPVAPAPPDSTAWPVLRASSHQSRNDHRGGTRQVRIRVQHRAHRTGQAVGSAAASSARSPPDEILGRGNTHPGGSVRTAVIRKRKVTAASMENPLVRESADLKAPHSVDVHTPKANVQYTTLDGKPAEISQKSPSNEYHTEHFT